MDGAEATGVLSPFDRSLPGGCVYAQNSDAAPPSDLALPIGLITGATAIVWLAIWLVLKDAARSAMLTVLALLVFDTIAVASGWVNGFLTELSVVWVKTKVHIWPSLIVGAELMLAATAAYLVLRMKRLRAWTTRLNIFALILLALPTATIARRWSEHPRELVQPESPTDPPPAAIASPTEQDASPTFSISSWTATREPT